MATKQLTYSELAEVWGVSRDAARKKVEGLRLHRVLGNDGRTRVTIDLEEVTHTPKPPKVETRERPAGDQEESNPGDREETGRRPTPEVLALHAQISALETRAQELRADLERERGERERERGERLQERERSERLTAEVADLARQLAKVAEEANTRERELQQQVRNADSMITAIKTAPWWRRLRGAA